MSDVVYDASWVEEMCIVFRKLPVDTRIEIEIPEIENSISNYTYIFKRTALGVLWEIV